MQEVLYKNGFKVVNITTDKEEDKKAAIERLYHYFNFKSVSIQK